MKNFLLKQKVVITLISASLASLLIIGGSVFLYSQSLLINNKELEISEVSLEQTHESTLIFKMNQAFVRDISFRKEVKDFLSDRSENKRVELLNSFLKNTNTEKKYLAIYLLDKNGIGLVSTDPRFVGQDYSFRDYFKKAIIGESFIDDAIGKTSKQFGYYFSNPVLGDKGDIIGVVVVKLDPVDVSTPFTVSSLSHDNFLMLVDEFGIILSATEADRTFKSLSILSDQEKSKLQENQKFLGQEIVSINYDAVRQAIRDYKNQTNIDFYDQVDGDHEIVNLNKLGDLPFYLVTEIRLDSVHNLIFSTVVMIVLITLVILSVISLIVYFLLMSFLNPLDNFKLFFTHISKGDFSQKLEIKTKDEFGDLALYVNKMTKDLSDLYKNLDEKVEEQTVEINEKIKDSTRQNKAILNILEDAEKEKVKVLSLAAIIKDTGESIIGQDLSGNILSWNKGSEKLYGYLEQDIIGKSVKLIIPEDKYEEIENIWKIVREGKIVEHFQTIRKRKDGSLLDVSISLSPIKDSNGKIFGISAITTDITKEKQIDKAKTEFVSLASHQLRSPLSAINWYTEMLLDGDAGVLNDEQKNYIDEISDGNKRMVDLVNNLLNVSRLDMGTFIVETKQINILELIESVLNESKPIVLEKKLVIEESYGKDIPEFSADDKLLRMIIQNLVSNAMKFSSSSGVIKVNASKLMKGENFGGKTLDEESLVFSVTDSGIGIPIYQQDKIFSKLFRADNAKTAEVEGTGLGLYVVKSIVGQSGGSVWFNSEENKETTFFLAFPITGMKTKKII